MFLQGSSVPVNIPTAGRRRARGDAEDVVEASATFVPPHQLSLAGRDDISMTFLPGETPGGAVGATIRGTCKMKLVACACCGDVVGVVTVAPEKQIACAVLCA